MQCYYFSFRGKVVNFLLQPRIHGVGWSHVFEHVVNEAVTGLHHYQLLNIQVVIMGAVILAWGHCSLTSSSKFNLAKCDSIASEPGLSPLAATPGSSWRKFWRLSVFLDEFDFFLLFLLFSVSTRPGISGLTFSYSSMSNQVCSSFCNISE